MRTETFPALIAALDSNYRCSVVKEGACVCVCVLPVVRVPQQQSLAARACV